MCREVYRGSSYPHLHGTRCGYRVDHDGKHRSYLAIVDMHPVPGRRLRSSHPYVEWFDEAQKRALLGGDKP